MVGVLHPVGIVFLPCLGTPKKKKKVLIVVVQEVVVLIVVDSGLVVV